MEKEKAIDILFGERSEEIYIPEEEQEKILQEDIVDLKEIIESVDELDDHELYLISNRYEEQRNMIRSEYERLYYIQGFKDAVDLLR